MEVSGLCSSEVLNRGEGVEEVIRNYEPVVNAVVTTLYSAYHRFVEKCDLYSQAHLTLVSMFNDGFFREGYGKYTLVRVKDKLLSELTKYCETESRYYNQVTSTDCVLLTNVDNNTLIKYVAVSILKEHVQRLPVGYREVIQMYFYDGMTYAEIADALEKSVSTVRTLRMKALMWLRWHSRYDRLNEFIDLYN